MAKKLNAYVHLENPETGERHVFAPGDTLPSWAKVGDHVYASDETEDDPVVPGPSQVVANTVSPAAAAKANGTEPGETAEEKAAREQAEAEATAAAKAAAGGK